MSSIIIVWTIFKPMYYLDKYNEDKLIYIFSIFIFYFSKFFNQNKLFFI